MGENACFHCRGLRNATDEAIKLRRMHRGMDQHVGTACELDEVFDGAVSPEMTMSDRAASYTDRRAAAAARRRAGAINGCRDCPYNCPCELPQNRASGANGSQVGRSRK
jgi:hypothetical protein